MPDQTMLMRDLEAESLETQQRVLDICLPCKHMWNTCPNTMCVMNIRRGRTGELMRVLGPKYQET